MSLKEYSRTKVFNVEQDAISMSLFGFYSSWQWACPNIYYVREDYFLLDISYLKAFPPGLIAHGVEQRGGVGWDAVLCMPLSTPDVAFWGIWRRSCPGEPQRCPAEKIFAAFLQNKLEWVFTSDITKCTNVSLKPGVRRKATGKWQARWWEFFTVTLLSPLEIKTHLCSRHK